MKRRNLIIAGLGLINATLLASIGLSVAWYASGALLYVQEIEITFRGDKKITAGLDEDFEHYKEDIAFDNKNYYPISSMFSDEWLDAKASKPRFRREYTAISHDNVDSYTKSELITTEEDGYFSKEIYLYCESNVILTIDNEKTSFTPDKEGNREVARTLSNNPQEQESIYNDLNDVVKSLRASILIPDAEDYHYYIINPYKEEEEDDGEVYLCGLMNYDDNVNEYYDSYFVEEERYEYFYGEYNDENLLIYDEPNIGDSSLIGNRPDKFHAKHQEGVHSVNLQDSLANGFVPKVEPSLSLKQADSTTPEGEIDGVRIKLKAFIPTKIVLSIYLEGWDKDNTSYVELGKFNTNISFRIGEEYF